MVSIWCLVKIFPRPFFLCFFCGAFECHIQGLGLMSQCFTSPYYIGGYFISNRYGWFGDVKQIPKKEHLPITNPLYILWSRVAGK